MPAPSRMPTRTEPMQNDEPLPTVSVVIPAKDDAELLARCLWALAVQSLLPHEIIVVDNNSSDDTAECARRYGATVISEKRVGIPAASAAGYDRATGEIIARLDADCVPEPDWLERVVTALAERPEAAAVTNGGRFIDGPRGIRGIAAFLYLGAYFTTVSMALGHSPLFGSNFAMRRTAWESVRGEVHRTDAMVHDDMDLSFHLGPDLAILRDRRLRMGISMRPLFDGRGGVRFVRGMRSVLIHWPAELPWLRLVRRLRSRLPAVREQASVREQPEVRA